MSAAAEILGSALHAHGARHIAVRLQMRVAPGGALAGVFQSAGLLIGIHDLAGQSRAVDGLQLPGHVVEGLQAVHGEVRAHEEQAAVRFSGPGQTHQGRPGEGRKPRAALVETALVADGPAPAIEPQLAGYGQTRGPGLQLVDVPCLDVLQRNGMVGEQKAIATLFRETGVANRCGDGADVDGILAVLVDEIDRMLPAGSTHGPGHAVGHRGGGGER